MEPLIHLLIVIIIAGLIFWLLWWALGKIGLPEPFNKVATVVLVLVAVLFLINMLMNGMAWPALRWR